MFFFSIVILIFMQFINFLNFVPESVPDTWSSNSLSPNCTFPPSLMPNAPTLNHAAPGYSSMYLASDLLVRFYFWVHKKLFDYWCIKCKLCVINSYNWLTYSALLNTCTACGSATSYVQPNAPYNHEPVFTQFVEMRIKKVFICP